MEFSARHIGPSPAEQEQMLAGHDPLPEVEAA